MMEKPKDWEATLDDLIRANFTYEDANTALKKKYGAEEGTLSGARYRDRKNLLLGGDNIDEKIDELGGRKKVAKPKKKPLWTKQKQTQADNSKLAEIVNMGVYQGMFPFCANGRLTEADVQEVNPGGAVVANINYFFPESKLEHPLVMLGVRIVILYLKFKSVCGKFQEVSSKAPITVGGGKTDVKAQGGLKSGMKTEMRK